MAGNQHQSYITIDECITAYIDEAEQSIHKYYKLWQLAFRGLTELGLDFFYVVNPLNFRYLANLTVPLPPDYLNYSKIGVLNSQGEIVPLMYNSKLTTYWPATCNQRGCNKPKTTPYLIITLPIQPFGITTGTAIRLIIYMVSQAAARLW